MQLTQTFIGVGQDFKAFFWPKKHWLKAVRLGVLVLLVLFGSRFLFAEPAVVPEETESLRSVTLVTPAEVAESQVGSFVGTVRAVSEAQIQSEVAGRVTAVNVKPGDTVQAGAVLATLENSAQGAAVLQAQGSYESALAAAAQSETGVESAEAAVEQAQNTAVAAVRGAVDTFEATTYNTIDTFFSHPDSQIPGVRIDSRNTAALNAARISLAQNLPTLRSMSDTVTVSSNLPSAISQTQIAGEQIVSIIDMLIADVRNASTGETLDGQTVSSYSTTLTAARSSIVGVITNLRSANTGITQAQSSLTQAQQAAISSESTVSAADAQVKTALGALRAAQAQYAKTILRSPISGTVNDVAVNTGDFISAFTQIAEVANNGSLEVSFYVTETEAATLNVGQAVAIGSKATGTIVSIAPAVNQATLKTEIRAAIDGADLTNGSSVTITPLTNDTAVVAADEQPIRLPLTAVRFTATDGSVFVVSADSTLLERPVTLGRVLGSTVVIEGGITATDAVVADVRGLTPGMTVSVATN